jgi:CheY-like chemotaxis protein
MEEFAHLINALVGLAWPAIAAVILYGLGPPIKSMIQSPEFKAMIRSREMTVQVAGFKVSVGSSIEELNRELAGIKAKLSQLESGGKEMAFSTIAAASGSENDAEPNRSQSSPTRILWVDDKPEGNAFAIDQLRSIGLEVDLAETTAEGMRKIDEADPPYNLVLSDIGRTEEGNYERFAGLSLLKQVRSVQSDLPVLFFTTSRTERLKPVRDVVDSDKNAYVTSSTTKLFDLINKALKKTSGTGN